MLGEHELTVGRERERVRERERAAENDRERDEVVYLVNRQSKPTNKAQRI